MGSLAKLRFFEVSEDAPFGSVGNRLLGWELERKGHLLLGGEIFSSADD